MYKVDQYLNKSVNWFGDQLNFLGSECKKFSKVKNWKEKNRKLFVILLPISLFFYLFRVWTFIYAIITLYVLFIAFWIVPAFLSILIVVFILSLPLLFWEIYTGKQSQLLTDFWRK